VKTTIDIPDVLYKKVKIHAIETGRTLKDIVLASLIKELEPASSRPIAGPSFMEKRKISPAFSKLDADGAFTPRSTDRDVTDLISTDRDGR
jgi:hypothetical protein